MHKMTKSTFEVRKHPATGERYVWQNVDELNKNYTETYKESYSGYMPERRGEKNCPVESFLLYLQHLPVRSIFLIGVYAVLGDITHNALRY